MTEDKLCDACRELINYTGSSAYFVDPVGAIIMVIYIIIAGSLLSALTGWMAIETIKDNKIKNNLAAIATDIKKQGGNLCEKKNRP